MKTVEGSVTFPRGFLAQGVCAEIKKKNKMDLAVIYSQVPARAAAVYTTNLVRAACIDLNRFHLRDGVAQAIVMNSGNANACTGEQGLADTIAMAEWTGQCLDIEPANVLVASTGVIGMYMPMERIEQGITRAAADLSREGGHNAALAIMTTDLVPKEYAVEIEIGGKTVRVGGIAKGSGMIHPNMATMLAFITTDAAIGQAALQKLLRDSVETSYNMISVDGDTSTNDMAVIMANGEAGNPVIDRVDSEEYRLFEQALDQVNTHLARMIARDGEGATRLIEVRVLRAPSESAARQIARTITTSNLTKAAVFGEDANWGRIFAAAGRAGVDFDPHLVDIYLGQEKMASAGMGLLFDEERARLELQQPTVVITVDLQQGDAGATAWGCDLSYDYVRINADYRT